MNNQEWLNKLKSDQENRDGIGMFVLDTFNEQIAEILAEHDAKVREDAIDECIKFIKEHSSEHYIDCDGYFGGQLEFVFKVDDWIEDLEQLKEKKNE